MSDEAWQPIETAPKDGRYIIAGRFEEQGELIWVKHSRWITAVEIGELLCEDPSLFDPAWTDGNNDDEPAYPTHWMPLPAPPTPKEPRA